ncbi:transposase [Stigmatella hybrida]|uniref:transposase n=1 Tax=Stigmatella hybrida TaxID=394097 RepID=UPI001CDA582B|nr:transposase [Stigmatella hybrida]
MKVIYPRCAAVEFQEEAVAAVVRIVAAGRIIQELQRFEATPSGLGALAEWLGSYGCRCVVMRATGESWKHAWYLLEGQLELVLAEPLSASAGGPGTEDALSLAELLAHGQIHGRPVPLEPLPEVRDLCRARRLFAREMAQHHLHIQKVLSDASMQATGAGPGLSGRAILQEFMAREAGAPSEAPGGTPEAPLAAHHRFMLKLHLAQVDALRGSIAQVDDRLAECLAPLHGVSQGAAAAQRLAGERLSPRAGPAACARG